jgi:hypothetical protein
MKLLYRTAEWHGFAKLRMHTDFTLDHLEELTKEFGLLMRQFRDLSCPHFQTVELPREVEARKRRQQLAQAKNSSTSTGMGTRSDPTAPPLSNTSVSTSTIQPRSTASTTNVNTSASDVSPTPAVPPSTSTRKPKTLNILTYKFHALGDYVRTIRLFGGTDSFSTQLVRFVCPGYYIRKD